MLYDTRLLAEFCTHTVNNVLWSVARHRFTLRTVITSLSMAMYSKIMRQQMSVIRAWQWKGMDTQKVLPPHTNTHARTHAHTPTQTHTRTHTHPHPHPHIHTHTHTRTHTHTHTHTHTLRPVLYHLNGILSRWRRLDQLSLRQGHDSAIVNAVPLPPQHIVHVPKRWCEIWRGHAQ